MLVFQPLVRNVSYNTMTHTVVQISSQVLLVNFFIGLCGKQFEGCKSQVLKYVHVILMYVFTTTVLHR